jgi:hypothetical protein
MSVSPFFLRDRITVEPDVLPSDEAQGDLKFSDMIRIGVLHLCWYVATVYAIKLRNNIFLATRTIHSWLPLLGFSLLKLFRKNI